MFSIDVPGCLPCIYAGLDLNFWLRQLEGLSRHELVWLNTYLTGRLRALPLPERIDALNYSLDPWECTGAAPQGWANHLQRSLLPIQGYIQLRPHDSTSLPSFGHTGLAPPMMLLRLLHVVLGRRRNQLAFLLGHRSARIPADTAGSGPVMLLLIMMTTPAMTVNKDFCTPTVSLVPLAASAPTWL